MISLFPEFSPMRVKYKDIFDMKAFYEALHEWLQEYGWKDYEDQVGAGDHWESFYGERIGQGGAREIWIRWRVHKKAPESDHLTYYLDIDFHCIALMSTEVVVKGRKIKTNKTIVPDVNGLIVQNRLDKDKGVVFSEYQDFGASSYSMSFQRPVTASFRVINKKSFAKINLTQLRTYSGDVSRVKVYYQTAAQSGYNLIGESVLQAPEILADPGVRFGKKKIGYFSDQGHLDYYWYSREGFRAGFWGGVDSADSVFGWNTPTASLTHQKTPYIDTMKISGSNYNYNEVVGLFHKFPMRLVAGENIHLDFNYQE